MTTNIRISMKGFSEAKIKLEVSLKRAQSVKNKVIFEKMKINLLVNCWQLIFNQLAGLPQW